ncbi:MAG: HAD family hydrolase [Firmicutes bacterium]|nr:HAD family hydrolase [Bacillota bacterium]
MVDKNNIVRYNPDIKYGLSTEEVKKRFEQNLVNYDTSVKTKKIPDIIKGNLFTLFNLLNFILGLAIFLVKSYKNLLFLGVVISNTVISTIQEIHAKKTIDKLSLIAATKVRVIRNGDEFDVPINEVVLDDIIKLTQGNQIVTDAIIMSGECEVNEAFITGESDPILKKKGDMILSGSFIVGGKVIAKVEHIGIDNYTSSISSGAGYIKKANSEILKSLNMVIKYVSIAIIPISLLLFNNQLHIDNNTLQNAVINTVAALIGMIPEGLILLTSTVFAVSVIRLSKYNVLVQQLYCSETLARVDVLCLDKTGTITEGMMEVYDIIELRKNSIDEINNSLCALCNVLEDDNATFKAIHKLFNLESDYKAKQIIPFSSQRKWSGAYFEHEGLYVIGAPEIVLKNTSVVIRNKIEEYSKENRVVVLAKSKENFNGKILPEKMTPLALILIRDKVRKEAIKTLNYFKDQGVDIKIISGDNVITVSNIAKRVGLENYDKCIDARKLNSYDEVKEAVLKYSIFGRVSPFQKKQIILALKEAGHTVAMTGDGVNDCLALKEADCSIALSSGSDAARNVSELVLLDSNFDSMPKIVAEGRRTINNIQRSATLFLVKTIYASLLAVIFVFVSMNYPFQPIQLTLTSIVTIGIPSFVLALERNRAMVKGNFLLNVISKAIPTALTIVTNILVVMLASYIFNINPSETSTLCVILTGYTGFILLYKLCLPFNFTRKILFSSMIILFLVGIIGLNTLFSLTMLGPYMIFLMIILMTISVYMFSIITILTRKIIKKYESKLIRKI